MTLSLSSRRETSVLLCLLFVCSKRICFCKLGFQQSGTTSYAMSCGGVFEGFLGEKLGFRKRYSPCCTLQFSARILVLENYMQLYIETIQDLIDPTIDNIFIVSLQIGPSKSKQHIFISPLSQNSLPPNPAPSLSANIHFHFLSSQTNKVRKFFQEN